MTPVEQLQQEHAGNGRILLALELAARAHNGQRYRGYGSWPSEPYIHHPARVALRVAPHLRVVALLHDVVEDTDVPLPEWLASVEVRALELLTRDKETQTYGDYIAKLETAPGEAGTFAREVKVADLLENLSHEPPPALRDRYELALLALGQPLPRRLQRATPDQMRDLRSPT